GGWQVEGAPKAPPAQLPDWHCPLDVQVTPLGASWHVPFEQKFVEHTRPQKPQLPGSTVRLTSQPLARLPSQLRNAERQLHEPLEHAWLAPQALPQAPQLSVLVDVLTHVPP